MEDNGKRDEIKKALTEDGMPEKLEVLDFIMDRLNPADELLQQAILKLAQETEAATTPAELEFLFGGINTVRSLVTAILEALDMLSEAHLTKYQEVMLGNPHLLLETLVKKVGMPADEAIDLASLMTSITKMSDAEKLDDASEDLGAAIERLKELGEELDKKREEKVSEKEPWNFTSL